MKFIEHVERFLGNINQGWGDKSSHQGLQIISFKNKPEEGVDTLITLGLSRHILDISSSKKVRHELLFSIHASYSSINIFSFLLSLCEMIVKSHKPLFRGEVIQLPVDIVKKVHFDAIYCAIPVFFDDDFATCYETNPPTVIVWILPINENEADFILKNGWDKFEDILEEANIDFFALTR